MSHRFRLARTFLLLLATVAAVLSGSAQAALGFSRLPATPTDGPVTLFYPTGAAETPRHLSPGLDFSVAEDAPPRVGNHRLVVISHGSGGSPWVYLDLARSLVDAGFVVAMPEHRGDNYRDMGHPGPDSWAIRPAEVSRAIDAVGHDPRFPQLALDHVGVYGMSAGGHTALSLAGGRWSRAGFKRHCDEHLAEDFQSCVGLITHLTGNGLADAIRLKVAHFVIDAHFDDDTPQTAADPRIAAIVAAVPFAADFDMASLAHPTVPLALVTARQDHWLTPRFHGERVLAACAGCERLFDTGGGHGSALSPLPQDFTGLEAHLLNDPPGFDRPAATAELDRKVTGFFVQHLQP